MKTVVLVCLFLFVFVDLSCSSPACQMEEIAHADLQGSDWTCENQTEAGACSMYKFVGASAERVDCSDNDCPSGDCAQRSVCVEWSASVCTKYNKGCYCSDEAGCHN